MYKRCIEGYHGSKIIDDCAVVDSNNKTIIAHSTKRIISLGCNNHKEYVSNVRIYKGVKNIYSEDGKIQCKVSNCRLNYDEKGNYIIDNVYQGNNIIIDDYMRALLGWGIVKELCIKGGTNRSIFKYKKISTSIKFDEENNLKINQEKLKSLHSKLKNIIENNEIDETDCVFDDMEEEDKILLQFGLDNYKENMINNVEIDEVENSDSFEVIDNNL